MEMINIESLSCQTLFVGIDTDKKDLSRNPSDLRLQVECSVDTG